MQSFDAKKHKRGIVGFNLYKKDFVLLVFPTGATLEAPEGLLQGKFPDGRKTVKFASLDEVTNRKRELQPVIKEWLTLVDK